MTVITLELIVDFKKIELFYMYTEKEEFLTKNKYS